MNNTLKNAMVKIGYNASDINVETSLLYPSEIMVKFCNHADLLSFRDLLSEVGLTLQTTYGGYFNPVYGDKSFYMAGIAIMLPDYVVQELIALFNAQTPQNHTPEIFVEITHNEYVSMRVRLFFDYRESYTSEFSGNRVFIMPDDSSIELCGDLIFVQLNCGENIALRKLPVSL